MIAVVRSELVRLRRRGFILGWLGLTAVMSALINVVMFQLLADSPGAAPADGPGVDFPSGAELLAPEGIVAGTAAVSSILGVITLSFWAIAVSSDYSTGLIRLLVSAHPRRWQLVVGKWLALAVCTALTSIVALVVVLVTAPITARAVGLSSAAWGADLPAILTSAAVNLFAALLVWGSIGLALATVTRSAGVAIGVGVGYVLLLESVIKAAVSGIAAWLPGSTIGALAGGGDATTSYPRAKGLGAAYVVVAFATSVVVHTRRDITD